MTDRRAVSTVLGYVLMLAIVSVLIGGLFFAAGDYVEGEHERVVRAEFEVMGNRLAADIAAVDRLALATEAGGRASLETDLPSLAAGRPYEITLEPSGVANVTRITLAMDDPAVEVEVLVRTAHPVASGTVSGGDAVVVYDGTDLEVRDG